jgi:hypothetical protein
MDIGKSKETASSAGYHVSDDKNTLYLKKRFQKGTIIFLDGRVVYNFHYSNLILVFLSLAMMALFAFLGNSLFRLGYISFTSFLYLLIIALWEPMLVWYSIKANTMRTIENRILRQNQNILIDIKVLVGPLASLAIPHFYEYYLNQNIRAIYQAIIPLLLAFGFYFIYKKR